jgi:hypothetical protein
MTVLADSNAAFSLRVDNSDFNAEVAMTAQGEGAFGLRFENSAVNSTGTDIAFALTMTGDLDGADAADILLLDNEITAINARALQLISNDGTLKTVDFELDMNIFTNMSGDTTVEIDATGGTTLNATITDNTFTNAGAGEQFDIATGDATANINLNLEGNTAGEFILREFAGSDFEIDEVAATLAGPPRNTGTVTPLPAAVDFVEHPGEVQRPTPPPPQ